MGARYSIQTGNDKVHLFTVAVVILPQKEIYFLSFNKPQLVVEPAKTCSCQEEALL